MLDLYISSLAMMGKTPTEMVETCLVNGWALEFSSGMPYHPNMEAQYLAAPVKRMPHNYFPAPEVPFVLNLASSNEKIRELSIAHCIKGLQLASKSASPFFAAHAGFCVDPDPAELGNPIQYDPQFDKSKHWELFTAALTHILAEAKELGIDFLVENNVIAKFNLTPDGRNPLLCTDSSEIVSLFDSFPDARFGLLLDTAHLKVSCHTLGLDLDQEVQRVANYIRGIHHSDNNGLIDNNQVIGEDYWFGTYVKQFRDIPQVLEITQVPGDFIQQQINLLTAYDN